MELTCCFFRAKDEYDTNKRLFVDTIFDIFYPSNIDNLFHIIFFRAIKQAPITPASTPNREGTMERC